MYLLFASLNRFGTRSELDVPPFLSKCSSRLLAMTCLTLSAVLDFLSRYLSLLAQPRLRRSDLTEASLLDLLFNLGCAAAPRIQRIIKPTNIFLRDNRLHRNLIHLFLRVAKVPPELTQVTPKLYPADPKTIISIKASPVLLHIKHHSGLTIISLTLRVAKRPTNLRPAAPQ